MVIAGRSYGVSAGLPGYPDGDGWAHHDITALPDGRFVTADPRDGELLLLAPDGRLERRLSTGLTESHGITAVRRGDATHLLVADNGHRFLPSTPRYRDSPLAPRVVEVDLRGAVVREFAQPDTAPYADADWSPTAVVEVPSPTGPRTWVADGYRHSLVHVYDATGRHESTLDGAATGRVFDTPHALLAVQGPDDVEVFVADRANGRIVVFGADGELRRVLGDGLLRTPSGLALQDGVLWVTELDGALATVTTDGAVTGRWGVASPEHAPTWPNDPAPDGSLLRPHTDLTLLVAPHGVTVDARGRVLVSEWHIGGRLVVLEPDAS